MSASTFETKENYDDFTIVKITADNSKFNPVREENCIFALDLNDVFEVRQDLTEKQMQRILKKAKKIHESGVRTGWWTIKGLCDAYYPN